MRGGIQPLPLAPPSLSHERQAPACTHAHACSMHVHMDTSTTCHANSSSTLCMPRPVATERGSVYFLSWSVTTSVPFPITPFGFAIRSLSFGVVTPQQYQQLCCVQRSFTKCRDTNSFQLRYLDNQSSHQVPYMVPIANLTSYPIPVTNLPWLFKLRSRRPKTGFRRVILAGFVASSLLPSVGSHFCFSCPRRARTRRSLVTPCRDPVVKDRTHAECHELVIFRPLACLFGTWTDT